jgi:hypothetical protein
VVERRGHLALVLLALPAYTSGLLVQDARPTLNRRPLADAVRWWAPVLGFLVRIGAEALG